MLRFFCLLLFPLLLFPFLFSFKPLQVCLDPGVRPGLFQQRFTFFQVIGDQLALSNHFVPDFGERQKFFGPFVGQVGAGAGFCGL